MRDSGRFRPRWLRPGWWVDPDQRPSVYLYEARLLVPPGRLFTRGLEVAAVMIEAARDRDAVVDHVFGEAWRLVERASRGARRRAFMRLRVEPSERRVPVLTQSLPVPDDVRGPAAPEPIEAVNWEWAWLPKLGPAAVARLGPPQCLLQASGYHRALYHMALSDRLLDRQVGR